MNAAAYTEGVLIEQPAIAVFRELGWTAANCFHEFEGGPSLGRETSAEVVLITRLRAASPRSIRERILKALAAVASVSAETYYVDCIRHGQASS